MKNDHRHRIRKNGKAVEHDQQKNKCCREKMAQVFFPEGNRSKFVLNK